jgi:flagellar biosynthesis protein FlhG
MRKPGQEVVVLQALRRAPVRVVSVSSGKGGVGKTNVAANLAVALGQQRRDVMLLDADLSLANVDVLLGLQPQYNLAHVVDGEVSLADTVLHGPAGIRIVPATSGHFSMTDLPQSAQAAIVHAFGELERHPEWLVVDTASGISPSVARFVQAAQHAVVVVCDEPTSLTDCYALIKVFSRHYGVSRFHVVTNRTRSEAEGRDLFVKLRKVTDRYLDVVLRHLGNVPEDRYLRHAVREQRAVLEAYPSSDASRAFRGIARALDALPVPAPHGGIQFFFERLLASAAAPARSLA